MKAILLLPTKLAMFLVALGFVTAPTRAGEAVTWAAASESACRVPLYDKTQPPATPNLEDLSLRPSVSQYGITWTFDKSVRVGQFINGDYYVVGPVTVTLIDPKPLWGDEIKETINKDAVREGNYPGRQARNGSMLNPRCDHKNQQGYRECAGFASLLLHMDYPAEEKERLLVPFIQVGIDFWGLARAGRSWPCHGGLNSGRKWPIVFAGLMLDDPEMQSPTKVLPKLHFHEDDQTAMCPYPYRGKVHERGWTGAKAIFTGHSLPRGGAAGNWEDGWGCVDLYPPTEWPRLKPDRAPASESYRRANTSNSWIGQALAVRLMHAEKVWDHDAFLAYVDRWMTEDDTPFVEAIKNAGGMDWTKAKRGEFGRQGYVMQAKFVREMWDAWRNALPPAPDGHEEPRAEETWK